MNNEHINISIIIGIFLFLLNFSIAITMMVLSFIEKNESYTLLSILAIFICSFLLYGILDEVVIN
jgi:hypothetical protein